MSPQPVGRHRRGVRRLALLCALAAHVAVSAQRDTAIVEVADLDGRVINPFDAVPGTRATVLLFVSTDCPISNRYAPELTRVAQEFSPLGVRFWLVYPQREVSSGDVRAHARDYRLTMPVVRDPRHLLVRRARTVVTPEAAVFNAAAELVYHGRIDDRFVDFGVQRQEPTERNLRDALNAVLDGTAVKRPNAPAVGCFVPSL